MTAVTTANAAAPAPTRTLTRRVFFPSPAGVDGSPNAPDGSGRITAIGSVGGPSIRKAADSPRSGAPAGARAGPHNGLRGGGSFPGSSKTGDPFTSGTFHSAAAPGKCFSNET